MSKILDIALIFALGLTPFSAPGLRPEALVAYLPKEKLVFQGDLVNLRAAVAKSTASK